METNTSHETCVKLCVLVHFVRSKYTILKQFVITFDIANGTGPSHFFTKTIIFLLICYFGIRNGRERLHGKQLILNALLLQKLDTKRSN